MHRFVRVNACIHLRNADTARTDHHPLPRIVTQHSHDPLNLPCRHIPFSWNEWLKFPVSYSDLPRNSLLVLTIWDIYGPRKVIPVGGTTVSVFGKHGWVYTFHIMRAKCLSKRRNFFATMSMKIGLCLCTNFSWNVPSSSNLHQQFVLRITVICKFYT